MHSLALLCSSSALLFALCHAAPRGGFALGVAAGIGASEIANNANSDRTTHAHESTTCSANQSGSIPDWAADPGWASSMSACLSQLNNDNWNGAECKPTASNGTALGPNFGFYKGKKNYDAGGTDCFNQCAGCLAQGIGWNQAQTTTCEYEYYTDSTLLNKQHCDMGFDYNT